MSMDHKSAIDDNKNDLLEVLRVGELLLTELCGEDVLDLRTMQQILAGGIQYEINERFLDWLKQSQPTTFTVCLGKLRGDQQIHIANLLDGTPGERPLTRNKRQQIQKNIRHLSEVIDVDSGLLMNLGSKKTLSPREQQEINSEKVTEDKAMKLLQVMQKKSDRSFNCFLEALRETNQSHVIVVFEKGNIIPLHVEFRSDSELLDQFEDNLISILEPIAHQVTHLDNEEHPGEEVQPLIHALQEICHKRLQILSLKKGQSITIYFYCEGISAMAELCVMYETGLLESILEKIFNLVKTSVQIPNVMIRVTLADNDLHVLKEAAKLSDLTHNKSELTDEDLFSKGGKTLQSSSSQMETEAKTELDIRGAELQTKKRVHGSKETLSDITRLESQLSLEMFENLKLKEKLEAIEQEKSKLKQQLQQTQKENTVLKEQLGKAEFERNKIKNLCIEIIKQKREQQLGQDDSVKLDNISADDQLVFGGVAYLRGNIYLLSTQHIIAYHTDSPYHRNVDGDIAIPEIGDAKDIAACDKTSSLYIADQKNVCVWKIMVDDLKPSKWLVDVGEPYTLSVTRDGRVLMPRSEPEPCLDVYNSRSDLVNHYPLPSEFWRPMHAVETLNGNFILSYYCEDITNVYGICELNGKGQVLYRSVYDNVGSEYPMYMAPGNDNWIFVARPDIHSVTLFEKQIFCDIITYQEDGIDNPSSLCYIRGEKNDCARLVIIYGVNKTEVAICTLPNAWRCFSRSGK